MVYLLNNHIRSLPKINKFLIVFSNKFGFSFFDKIGLNYNELLSKKGAYVKGLKSDRDRIFLLASCALLRVFASSSPSNHRSK